MTSESSKPPKTCRPPITTTHAAPASSVAYCASLCAMSVSQPPAATAVTMSTLLPLPPRKSLSPFYVPELSWSKKPALLTGGCGGWRFLPRKPGLSSVRVTGPSKMTEMVRAPDGFGDNRWDGGEAEDGGPGKREAVVLRDGSLEFRVDIASEGLESTLNKLSKWVVAGLFGIIILWKHDAEALWVTMGSIINAWLSTQLKQILNHQRPDPVLRSDPGMPSSHAQSIFYISTYAVVSLVDSLGFNTLTVSLGALTLACSSYLSWLRVSQKLHTANQIGVGAAVGSAFCITWFWLWRAFVLEAFISSIWVRIALVIGSAAFCVAFTLHVVQHWLRDDE